MKETIAVAIGRSPGMESKITKLGESSAEGQANTFNTFTTAKVEADGSGSVSVGRRLRDGRNIVIHHAVFGPEGRDGEDIVEVWHK